jgi:uncharacterized protein (TIGR01244 family)
MRNAKKFDDRITIGIVPDNDDLAQLQGLGYKTLIDLRDEHEKFGGLVKKRTEALGMKYISIEMHREAIKIEDVKKFYAVAYDKGSAPVYAFSRFGKKPLALLLLFEAVAKCEPAIKIFRRADEFGLNLEGDLPLQAFLVNFYNSRCIEPVVESIRQLRPDLLKKEG